MTTLNEMTKEQLIALVAQMQTPSAKKLTMKVAAKGGLSVYGLGQYPVTLYRTQWEKLLADECVAQIKSFIQTNAAMLTVKA